MKLLVDDEGLPILNQFSEEGFVDCVFRIQRQQTSPSDISFHLAASFNGSPVGFDVRVVTPIKAGFTEDMQLNHDHVYREGVQFLRSGPESDQLISALSTLYGLPLSEGRMVDNESFTAIALHQGDIDMASDAIKIKMFGNDQQTDNDKNYCESFFNLDLPNKLVFWNEKDQEYREPLVRFLSKHVA